MSEAEALISKLADEGKPPQAIAEELNARGLRGRMGRVFGAADVEGFLRFVSAAGIEIQAPVKITGAMWGTRAQSAEDAIEAKEDSVEPEKRRRHRWVPHFHLSDDQRAEITRLYRQENMRSAEIAAKLGLPIRRVNPFCGHLAGYDVPPGEIVETTDEQGRKVSVCPAAFARGVSPQRNVRPTQGGW